MLRPFTTVKSRAAACLHEVPITAECPPLPTCQVIIDLLTWLLTDITRIPRAFDPAPFQQASGTDRQPNSMTSLGCPTSVLLLRHPVSIEQGTDAYHDIFGSFCLPSFALSALDSRSSTPGTPKELGLTSMTTEEIMKKVDHSLYQHNLSQKRLEMPAFSSISNSKYLMTHHMCTEDMNTEFCIVSIPILSHVSVGIDKIVDKIEAVLEQKEEFNGVVFTSQRAVQAWEEACSLVATRAQKKGIVPMNSIWNDLLYFVVGPSTARKLEAIDVLPAFKPLHIFGEDSGTGEALGHHIVSMAKREKKPLRFLYLVGNKRTQSLINVVSSSGLPIELVEHVVYEVRKDAQFSENCGLLANELPRHVSSAPTSRGPSVSPTRRAGLRKIESQSATQPEKAQTRGRRREQTHLDWIVFFSPSGGNYAMPDLQQQGWVSQGEYKPGTAKIACIGTTTASWVDKTLGYRPHAVAAHPTPTSLRDAILEAISKSTHV